MGSWGHCDQVQTSFFYINTSERGQHARTEICTMLSIIVDVCARRTIAASIRRSDLIAAAMHVLPERFPAIVQRSSRGVVVRFQGGVVFLFPGGGEISGGRRSEDVGLGEGTAAGGRGRRGRCSTVVVVPLVSQRRTINAT